MTTTKKPPVPYAERLARESVKFGLRVGGSLLRHTPGLLKIGVLGLPFALLGGIGSTSRDEAEDLDQQPHVAGANLLTDEYGEPLFLSEQEFIDYHEGRLGV